MTKFEGAPNVNNPEQNPNEIGAGVNDGKKLEGELTPKELEKLKMEQGQGQEPEKPELSPEKRPFEDDTEKDDTERLTEEKVTDTISRVENIDEKIFGARKRAAEDEAKIKGFRESLGVTANNETSPSTNFSNNKIAKLEAERAELAKERDELIEEFGRDNLPEGLAIEDGENGREVKGVDLSPEKQPELTDKEKREQAKERRGWLETWKKDAVISFEKGMRNDWRTKDAINLETTIKVMKLRVPNAMEKEMKDFVDGKTEDLPSVVWIHWNCNGLLDKILGKPNMIKNLDITFDKEVVRIADEKDLEEKDKKPEESKLEEEPKDKVSENEAKPKANPVERGNTKT